MDAEDVGAFLASVGSPLAQGGEVQKTLPASAVLQLLNTRIEALVPPSEPAHDAPSNDAPQDDGLDDEVLGALRAYAHATAHYTHTSLVSSTTDQLTAAVKGYTDVQAALDARDGERLHASLPPAQHALYAVGIDVDFLRERIKAVPSNALAQCATVTRLFELCHATLRQMHTQVEADWERAVQVIDVPMGMALAVQESLQEDPESINIPSLLDLWEFACAMNLGQSVALRISELLEKRIIQPLLGDLNTWTTAQSTTSDAILTQLVFTPKPGAIDDDAAIPALVDLLAFLRTTLFRASAHDAPAVQDARLAPTLQVLVAHHLVPCLLHHVKSYILQCLPQTDTSLQAYGAAMETAARLALRVQDALVAHGYVCERSESETMVRCPGWAPLEPLSDLRQWTEHLVGPCTQYVLGGVLDLVRTNILRTDDRAWDTVPVETHVENALGTEPPSAPQSMPKPRAGQPMATPEHTVHPASPKATTPPKAEAPQKVSASSKAKKPTLGSVKRLGAVPVAEAPKPLLQPVPEPQDDDWGWGDDEETLAEPKVPEDLGTSAPTSAPDAPPSEPLPASDEQDDWGWGSDDEVDDLLRNAPPPQEAQATSAQPTRPTPEESALDAWDWNETDVESSLPEEADPDAVSPPIPQAPLKPVTTTHTLMVSQRGAAVAAQAKQQFELLSHTSDSQLRQTVAKAVLECVQLYRALMPAVHAASLQHVPLLSMLFANDCDYLAEELQMLARSAKQTESPTRDTVPFDVSLTNEAQALHDVGDQWRHAQMNLQSAALQECLDQADGFVRTDVDARHTACERAVAQVDHILQHLVTVWAPILPQPTLISLLGELVQSVFVRVQSNMEDLDDISEPESVRLAALCRTLLEAQTALFAEVAHCDTEAAGAQAATAVPNWFKFSYLPELLTGSLADIEFLLFDSGGALLDYAREEVTALIRALFADTPNRRRLLDRVHRAPWTSTQSGLA